MGTWTILAALLVAYGVILARHVGAYAGGSDSSGYLNHARLLADGRIHLPIRTIAELAPEHPRPWMFSALGFRPAVDGHDLVPTYPSGLPLLLAGTAVLIGWAHAGAVVMWLHAIAGVLLTYATGRVFGLSFGLSVLSAIIVAASPLYVFFSVTLMSDVPALVWGTAALLAAVQASKRSWWALLAGAAFAMGVLIRPTNFLMLAPIGFVLGRNVRHWALFIIGGLPGGTFFLAHNHAAYGAYFTSGYGNAAQLEKVWIEPTLRHYARWLPIVFTPAVIAVLGLPFIARSRGNAAIVLGTWVLVIAGFYSAYEFTHQTWWFLRFLLPAAPALVVGSLLVMSAVRPPRISAWARKLTLSLAVIAAIAFEYHWTDKLAALHSGEGEKVYAKTSEWLNDHLPRNAVLAVMQTSGAVVYGTQFPFVRWDWLQGDNFPAIAERLRAAGRPLYATVFPDEITDLHVFSEHMAFGRWVKTGTVDQVTIWRWEPEDGRPPAAAPALQ